MKTNIGSFDKILQSHNLDYPVQYYQKITVSWNNGDRENVKKLFYALPANFQEIAIRNGNLSNEIIAFLYTSK